MSDSLVLGLATERDVAELKAGLERIWLGDEVRADTAPSQRETHRFHLSWYFGTEEERAAGQQVAEYLLDRATDRRLFYYRCSETAQWAKDSGIALEAGQLFVPAFEPSCSARHHYYYTVARLRAEDSSAAQSGRLGVLGFGYQEDREAGRIRDTDPKATRAPEHAELLQSIQGALARTLEREGFLGDPEILEAYGTRLVVWRRESAWKRDAVRLHCPVGGLSVGLGVDVSLRLGQNEALLFDGISVGGLTQRDGYWLPEVETTVRGSRLRARVVSDCEQALRWFGDYSSPARALERLRSGLANGCGRSGSAYQRALEFLEGRED